MRSGAYTIQQILTAEAASVLKHSLTLARRRGHSQVTPLHVAATLLSSRSGILRRACLKSQLHSIPIPIPNSTNHHLHCRALELCFNVALNRLPTSPPPLLHGCLTTLSNSLIAALKRAQALQRRGCIEQQQQQQQPLLAVKVEVEQLVISILDDPSVSRVMKEAGFSSTSIKSNIEEDDDSSSVFPCYMGSGGGVFSFPSSPTRAEYTPRGVITAVPNPGIFWQTQPRFLSQLHSTPPKKNLGGDDSVLPKEDDMKLVLEVLLRKKRRNVVVVGDSLSATDGLVAELMGRVERGEVPDELKSAHFIKFQFAPLSFSYMKSSDVDSNVSELKAKIDGFLVKGDGAVVYVGDLTWASEDKCGPVADHLVSEMGKLLSGYLGSSAGGVTGKVWLLGTANLQTYTRFQEKKPWLEVQWGMQAVSVPSGGLGLSLRAAKPQTPASISSEGRALGDEGGGQLTCPADSTSNWVFPDRTPLLDDDPVDLKRKWNAFCQGLPQEKTSPIPCGYTFANQSATTVPRFRRQRSCTVEFSGWSSTEKNPRPGQGPNLDSLRNSKGGDMKITLSLGNSLFSDSGKLAEHDIERMLQRRNARRLLQDNVPWQSETIPAIVEALFHSKSAVKDTWMLVHGNDTTGKRRLARAIAEAMFGSSDMVINLNMRTRNSAKSSYSEILARISQEDEKLVVLVENIEMADKQLIKFLSDSFEMGKISDSSHGRVKDRGQVVYILTKGDSFTVAVDGRKSQNSVVRMAVRVFETSVATSIDLKRRADWDSSDEVKVLKTDGNGNGNGYPGILRKEISKPPGFGVFDLNEKGCGDGSEVSDKDAEEVSPNSSDLTGESGGEITSPKGFLGLIENRFIFNRSGLTREMLMSKIKGSFEEVYGVGERVRINVEEGVLEGIEIGAGFFLNSLFEEWLKDTFQTAMMHIAKRGKDDGISIISLGLGEGDLEEEEEEGYMNTCLPNIIQLPSVN